MNDGDFICKLEQRSIHENHPPLRTVSIVSVNGQVYFGISLDTQLQETSQLPPHETPIHGSGEILFDLQGNPVEATIYHHHKNGDTVTFMRSELHPENADTNNLILASHADLYAKKLLERWEEYGITIPYHTANQTEIAVDIEPFAYMKESLDQWRT